jgi:hypothetical protein
MLFNNPPQKGDILSLLNIRYSMSLWKEINTPIMYIW